MIPQNGKPDRATWETYIRKGPWSNKRDTNEKEEKEDYETSEILYDVVKIKSILSSPPPQTIGNSTFMKTAFPSTAAAASVVVVGPMNK